MFKKIEPKEALRVLKNNIHYSSYELNETTKNDTNSRLIRSIRALDELVDEKLEQESRKDKLVEGSEWVCEVDNNGDNLVFTRGAKVVVIKTEEHFDYDEVSIHVHVYINGRSGEETIPIDQFLLCFKPLKEEEEL